MQDTPSVITHMKLQFIKYLQDTPSGRWTHDKFEGGRSSLGGGGGGGGGGRGIAKLLISNLEYSVNDQDIRVSII